MTAQVVTHFTRVNVQGTSSKPEREFIRSAVRAQSDADKAFNRPAGQMWERVAEQDAATPLRHSNPRSNWDPKVLDRAVSS